MNVHVCVLPRGILCADGKFWICDGCNVTYRWSKLQQKWVWYSRK